MTRPTNIKRGPMTDDERAEIERLATTLKKPTPSAIARRLNRHACTVNWHMIRHGLIRRRVKYIDKAPYQRCGKTVYPYTPEHDMRILELRTASKGYTEIAKTISAEFGIERTAHNVHVRLTMLAAYDDAEAA